MNPKVGFCEVQYKDRRENEKQTIIKIVGLRRPDNCSIKKLRRYHYLRDRFMKERADADKQRRLCYWKNTIDEMTGTLKEL